MITSKFVSPRTALKTYPHLDTEATPLSPRSRLFRLEPIGIGTPDVECLTSYVTRLAAEHCVSPRKLLCKEVLAPAGKATIHYSTSSIFSASLINGMGQLATLTVDTLERMTLRNDLRYMTMLGWRNVLSTHLLLRTKKAWCPICYEELLNEGRPIYDPLIWSFKLISLCPRHHEPLRRTCPHCKSNLPFLTTLSYPGFCSKCQAWLGTTVNEGIQGKKNSVDASIKPRQISEAHSTGQLLSFAVKSDSPPSLSDLTINLGKYVEQRANGSINLFSVLVDIWSGTIRRLLVEETKLSLKMLCQLSSRLNISPHELLFNRDSKEILGDRRLTFKQNALHTSNRSEAQKTTHVYIKEARLNRIAAWDQAENALLAACKEDPPPSLKAVVQRFGRHTDTVKRYFPKQCEQIFSRYWEYRNNSHPPHAKVRTTLRRALKEQPPPSLQSVLRRLGCRDTGAYYYKNYSDLCFAVSHRYKTYRNNPFNEDTQGKYLHDTLNEYPPPSFSEVARRLGHTREFVRRKFPKLSTAIVSRHLHYQAALRKETASRLHHAVRAAVQEIIASEQYVSEAKVREHIRRHLPKLGRDSLFKQALREVKLEFGLTK
jgi:hypothetical protein